MLLPVGGTLACHLRCRAESLGDRARHVCVLFLKALTVKTVKPHQSVETMMPRRITWLATGDRKQLRIGLLVAVWSAPLACYLAETPLAITASVGLVAMVTSLVVSTMVKPWFAMTVPFVAVLAPVVSMSPFGFERILLSDLFVLGAVVLLSQQWLMTGAPIALSQRARLVGLGGVLAVISWAVSLDPVSSLPGLLNICLFGAVYLITVQTITSEALARKVVWAWVIAAFLGAVLTVHGYIQGTPLLFGSEGLGGSDYVTQVRQSQFFYRANYFYSNFFFVIGLAGVFLFIRAFEAERVSERLGCRFGLFILLGVLFLMNNKSALVGLAVIVVLEVAFFRFGRSGFPRALRVLWATLIVAVIIMSVGMAGRVLVGEGQWESAVERLSDLESLKIRLQIVQGVAEYVVSSPKVLLVGLGPDVTTRMAGSGNPVIEMMLTNPVTGSVEGAIDSTYVTMLVEYGGLFVAAVLVVAVQTLRDLSRYTSKHQGTVARALRAIVLWWMVVGLAQATGTSKMAWAIVQVVAVSHAVFGGRMMARVAKWYGGEARVERSVV